MDTFKDPYGILRVMAAKERVIDEDNEGDPLNPSELMNNLAKVIYKADNRILGKKDEFKLENCC